MRAAAGLLLLAAGCGSSSGGSAAPCAVDAEATIHDASVDTGAAVDAAGSDAVPTDAGLACEAGSVSSMGQCTNVAGSLEGLRWELPCSTDSGLCGTVYDGGNVEVVSTTLAGTPGQTYAVTLHFRGVAEMRTYVEDDAGAPQNTGAMGVANAQFFVSGGGWLADGFNVYELDVSDPPGVYFVNSGVSHLENVWWLDNTATIAIKAGATVTLTANSLDSFEVANVNGMDGGPVLVPGVPPYPQAYDGQFIQMDVVSVEVMP